MFVCWVLLYGLDIHNTLSMRSTFCIIVTLPGIHYSGSSIWGDLMWRNALCGKLGSSVLVDLFPLFCVVYCLLIYREMSDIRSKFSSSRGSRYAEFPLY